MVAPDLVARQPDLLEMIPATRSFTMRSEITGGTYGIWVTVPPGYSDGDAALPVVYVLDGNTQLALTAPLGYAMMLHSVSPIRPYIQVTIGYVGEDAKDFLRLRNRDLVPPGEPYPHQMAAHLRPRLEAGLLTEAEYAVLLDDLRHCAADRFLSFIQHELHRRIVERWRVDSEHIGLFGYSYGGLFSMYAFVTDTGFFDVIGASSPGILSADSEIFQRYDQRAEEGVPTRPARLHLTVNDSELTSDFPLYRDLAAQYLSLVDRIRQTPLRGMRATAQVVSGQTHGTGVVDAYRSFLRFCYTVAGHPPGSEIAWEPTS